ncbi:MAG TPA: SH3 domain-containing protein [Burkholderiaceae bacterium]|nr:SH3 domain-containing protein [Burkholderiaceae bacterium]
MTAARLLHCRLLFIILFLAIALPAHARQMVSVDRPSIHMRSGAGTQHEALWKLNRGYPLLVIGRSGQWLKVRDFENDVGWVYRPLTGSKPHFVVKVKTANVRSGPGTRSRVVGKVHYGEVLRTLERRSGWVRVRQEGGPTGWVARSLLWGW